MLLISEDLEELVEMSDRLLVMYEGAVVGEFPRGAWEPEPVGHLMTGSGRQPVPAERNAAARRFPRVVGETGRYAGIALVVLAVFGGILLVAGKDPLKAYADTFHYTLANAYGLSELLVRMTPLLLTAVAVALPSRLGLINVGGEGQLYLGAWLAIGRGPGFPAPGRPGSCCPS